ncbi:MAG: hypothetical protein ABR969_09565 [Sedimentisphaerales bacterium]
MIKTMRITGFVAAAIMLGLLIFISARSMAANGKVETLLKIPGAAEQFQANLAGKRDTSGEQETPLIKQAKAFALRINPPPPPAPVVQAPIAQEAPRPQATITAKFKLIGTSYHIGDANDSWALIDEVGKGLHWVKQGGKVGYLTIEKVGDGGVLINDNGKTYELTADRAKKPDLVKSYTGKLENDKPIIVLTPPVQPPPAPKPVAGPNAVVGPNNVQQQPPPVVELSPEEQRKQTQENIEWLKKMQQDSNSGMSTGEANQLGGLGDLLKAMEQEAKRGVVADSNSPKSAGEVNQPDPNQQKPPSQPQQQTPPKRLKSRSGK